jgi:hypothetical protein
MIKKYIALLTQSSTNDPVATVLENSIGDVVWTRDTAGTYLATLSGAFPLEKTALWVPCAANTFRELYNNEDGTPSGMLVLITSPDNSGPQDGQLYYTPVEIIVYP